MPLLQARSHPENTARQQPNQRHCTQGIQILNLTCIFFTYLLAQNSLSRYWGVSFSNAIPSILWELEDSEKLRSYILQTISYWKPYSYLLHTSFLNYYQRENIELGTFLVWPLRDLLFETKTTIRTKDANPDVSQAGQWPKNALAATFCIAHIWSAYTCSHLASQLSQGKPNHIIPSSLISILVCRAVLKYRFGLKAALVMQ